MIQPVAKPQPTVLLTGYAPWPGQINASQILVESLRDDMPAALLPYRNRLACHILPLSTRDVKTALLTLIDQHQPDYCIFTGQAPGRNRITLERLATNLRDFSEADGLGIQPRGETVEADGPAAYWSTLPGQEAMVRELNAAGIPCAFSNHAGNHLCNQVLYHALHHAARRGGPRAGFVHIPIVPEQLAHHANAPFMPLAMLRTALEGIVSVLLRGAA